VFKGQVKKGGKLQKEEARRKIAVRDGLPPEDINNEARKKNQEPGARIKT